jgi:single-stranded DNA-binding protein
VIYSFVDGRIGKDAVTRKVGDQEVTNFSIASSRYAGKGKGQNKQDGSPGDYATDWVDVAIWGKRGVTLAPKLVKGGSVTAIGELGRREHDGKTCLTLDAKEIRLQGAASGGGGNGGGGNDHGGQGGDDTDIPF